MKKYKYRKTRRKGGENNSNNENNTSRNNYYSQQAAEFGYNRRNNENNNNENHNNQFEQIVEESNNSTNSTGNGTNNEIVQRNNINNITNIGKCFDVAMYNNDADAKNFLKEDDNNIIIIAGKKAICVNRKQIKKYTQFFYECKEDNGKLSDDNVISSTKYGKLMPFNQFVSENDLELMQNKEFIFFKLNEIRNANAFVSVLIKNHQGSFVSGDHCQGGSGGKIYGLKGYTLNEGITLIKNINKNNQTGGKHRNKTHKKFKKPTDADMFLDHIATGRIDLVEEYLDNNGSVKKRNCKGETALHIAVAHHQNDILERILPYFTENELDIRDMYGLPAHITAIKYGNDYGARLLSNYYRMIKTKPYKFKNYSFLKNKNSLQEIINKISISNKNPIIYPNQPNKSFNLMSYMPTKPNKNKSPVVLSYNNKNTKKFVFNNKKKTRKTKKKPQITITRNI